MDKLRKYTWLIDTVRRAGRISHKELSQKWKDNWELSDNKPLARATFNRWRDSIREQFHIDIGCQKVGGYLYFIANPDVIEHNKLKKWMLDSFAVSNVIGDSLSLKDRILIDEIPSGRLHLTTMLEAMKENRVVKITHHQFGHEHSHTFPVEPYCVKLFENRWYVLARTNRGKMRIYGLDRIEEAEITDETFELPAGFDANEYFAGVYGIVFSKEGKPEPIVIRAYEPHKYYMRSLPLHESQYLIEDCGEYADFGLYLKPTFDFIMKLLQYGAMIEVLRPASLRKDLKGWISEAYEMYKDDVDEQP